MKDELKGCLKWSEKQLKDEKEISYQWRFSNDHHLNKTLESRGFDKLIWKQQWIIGKRARVGKKMRSVADQCAPLDTNPIFHSFSKWTDRGMDGPPWQKRIAMTRLPICSKYDHFTGVALFSYFSWQKWAIFRVIQWLMNLDIGDIEEQTIKSFIDYLW